jgi:hypothetical protein
MHLTFIPLRSIKAGDFVVCPQASLLPSVVLAGQRRDWASFIAHNFIDKM